jgi:Aerotolerance regulator N-terminal
MTAIFCVAIGFLAPGMFAAGAALISVPIIIHLLNRRRFRVVQWAAMDYLLAALKKNRRRLKFESLLLLVTRCALLLLLGTALARPFGCQNNGLAALAGRRSALHVFIIDNGYAMGYEFPRPGAKTHLDQAKIVAKELIDRLSAGSEAVVILTTTSETVPQPTYDLEAAKAMVDRVDQTYAATEMRKALDRAGKAAASAGDLPIKVLYLLDDSTRHVWSDPALATAGKDLPRAFTGGIIHYNFGRSNEFNPVVMDLSSGQRLATLVGEFAPSFAAKLRAYGEGPDSQLIWKIDDARVDPGGGALHLDLSDHLATLGRAAFPGGGPHVVSASLIADDKLTCDDTRWRVVNVASDLKMLLVEGTTGSGLYLKAALDPDPVDALARKSRLVNIDTISDLELGTRPLVDYRCIALCGVGQITDAVASRLENFVNDGGALWVFAGPQTSAENYNATLLKHHLLPGPLAQRIIVPAATSAGGDGVRFDFDPAQQVHPLLAPFYQSQGSGLENVRVFSYWQVDIPANSPTERVLDYQPLAGSTRKDAALTVHTVGRGRVVFCSTTADANDEWTAFPAKKAFPEVMLCMFLGTVSTDEDWMNLGVGDVVRPPVSVRLNAAPRLRDAAGEEFALTASQTDDGLVYQSVPLKRPGVYTLTTGAGSYPIAVNVPTTEADTRLMDSQAIRSALGGIDMDFETDTVPQEAAAAEQGRDFGWSVMLVVLGLVGAESFMAMKFGRFKRR